MLHYFDNVLVWFFSSPLNSEMMLFSFLLWKVTKQLIQFMETCEKATLSSGEPSNRPIITSIYDDEEVVGFEK